MFDYISGAIENSPISLLGLVGAIIAFFGFSFIRIINGKNGSQVFNRVLESLVVVSVVGAVVSTGVVIKSNQGSDADAREDAAASSTTAVTTKATSSSEMTTSATSSSVAQSSVRDLPNVGVPLSTLNAILADSFVHAGEAAALGDVLYPDSVRYQCNLRDCLEDERSIRFEVGDDYTQFSALLGIDKTAKDLQQIGEFTLISHGPDGVGKELGRWVVGYVESPIETGVIDISGAQQLELRMKRVDVVEAREFHAIDLVWGTPTVYP